MWVEDRTGALEVVVWNDVYVVVAEILVPGRVVEVRGTIDTRGDSLRATAQKIKVPSANKPNGAANENAGLREEAAARQVSAQSEPAVLLQFSPATTTEELREVRELLASSPGQRRVQLLFDRPTREPLPVHTTPAFPVDLPPHPAQRP